MKRERIHEFRLRIPGPAWSAQKICCDEKWVVIFFDQVLFVFKKEQLSAHLENRPLYVLKTSLCFLDAVLDNQCLFVLEDPDPLNKAWKIDVYNVNKQTGFSENNWKIQELEKSSHIWLSDWGLRMLPQEIQSAEMEITKTHIFVLCQTGLYSRIAVFNKERGIWTFKIESSTPFRHLVFENTFTCFHEFPYYSLTSDLDTGETLQFVFGTSRSKTSGTFLRNSEDSQVYWIDHKFSRIMPLKQCRSSALLRGNGFGGKIKNYIRLADRPKLDDAELLANEAVTPKSLCLVGNNFITCSKGTPRILRFYDYSVQKRRKKRKGRKILPHCRRQVFV